MGQATPIGRSPNRKFLSKREWWSTIRPETPAHRCPSTLKGGQIVLPGVFKGGVGSPLIKYGTVLLMKLGIGLCAEVRVQG